MAYADDIRAADTCSLDTIADSIETLWGASGALVWTSYNPTWGVEGGGSFSTNPADTDVCYYTVIGDLTLVIVYGYGTTTGTVTAITITAPSTPTVFPPSGIEFVDNGTAYGGLIYSPSGTIKCVKADRTGITGGATTGMIGLFGYYN